MIPGDDIHSPHSNPSLLEYEKHFKACFNGTNITVLETFNNQTSESEASENIVTYINIEQIIFEPESDGFTVRVVNKPDEVKALLEVCLEYVCQKDELMFFRKRK